MSNQGAAMSNGRPHSANNTSPLRQQLAGLGVRAAGAPLPCFGERLARLFDLSDTVALDAANVSSRDGHFSADDKATERLRAELEKLRQSQREAIEASVTAERVGTRNGLPEPQAGPSPALPAFLPGQAAANGRRRAVAAAESARRPH
jgi:hypothetical protein